MNDSQKITVASGRALTLRGTKRIIYGIANPADHHFKVILQWEKEIGGEVD